MRQETFHHRIDAEHVSHALRLREVWNYRYLIRIFTRKQLVVRYKQTVLGPLWQLIYPLLTSLIHMLIFGVVAGIGTDGIPMILFYLAGNSIWAFTSSIVNRCANTFRDNAYLFGKVYFPRLCVPLSDILTAATDFMIKLALLFAVSLYYACVGRIAVNYLTWLLLPLILCWLGMMAMGIGILVSSFTTKYRDLSILVSFGVQLWMYVTPVVYPISQLPKSFVARLIQWNPASAPVEVFRRLLFGTPAIEMRYVISSLLFTLLVFVLGVQNFNRVEKTFMDTI